MLGRYPGGPSRRNAEESKAPPRRRARLRTVQEIEGIAVVGAQARKRKAREKRLLLGLILSLVISGSVGLYMGIASHRTDAELAQELKEDREAPMMDLEKQADRLISEMWKSEALEKSPRIR